MSDFMFNKLYFCHVNKPMSTKKYYNITQHNYKKRVCHMMFFRNSVIKLDPYNCGNKIYYDVWEKFYKNIYEKHL